MFDRMPIEVDVFLGRHYNMAFCRDGRLTLLPIRLSSLVRRTSREARPAMAENPGCLGVITSRRVTHKSSSTKDSQAVGDVRSAGIGEGLIREVTMLPCGQCCSVSCATQ